MSNIVNLNQFRKSKARSEKRAKADENAVKFGRNKAQKTLEQTLSDKAKQALDGHTLKAGKGDPITRPEDTDT